MKAFRFERIETRLVFFVGIGLLLFSLVAGAVTYALAFRDELDHAAEVQQQLVRTVKSQAEVAAFAANAEIGRGVLASLLVNPVILAVRLEAAPGFKLEQGVNYSGNFSQAQVYPLLSPVDKVERIGTLSVLQNDAFVTTAASRQAFFFTLLLLLQVLIAAGLLVAILRLVMTRPVTRLARSMMAIQPGGNERVSVDAQHARDEIGLLAKGANSLLAAAEHAIREERDLHKLLETTGQIALIGGWTYDTNTQELTWTRELYRMHARDPNNKISLDQAVAYFTGPSRGEFLRVLNDARQYGTSFDLELQLLNDAAETLWVRIQGQLQADDNRSTRMYGALQNITERKIAQEDLQRSEAALKQQNNLLSSLLKNLPVGVFMVEVPSGKPLVANAAACELLGQSVMPDIVPDRVAQDYRAFVLDSTEPYPSDAMPILLGMTGETSHVDNMMIEQPDGSRRLLEVFGSPVTDEHGHIWASLVSFFDISARKLAEERLRLAASVFSHALEGILITDPDGTIIDVNDAFCRITGYSRDEALGRNPRFLSSGRQSKDFYKAMWQALLKQGHWYGEVWNLRRDGKVYAEMLTISAVRDAHGVTRQYVALFSDITSLKEHQHRLEHIAHYDVLTSMPNRALLADRLHLAMSQAQRRNKLLAAAYLDLDGFKAINDSHGHDAGDQLLIAVAARLKQALRDGDTLARLGGDEFVAVLVDLEDTHASLPMLQRLLEAAAQPVRFGNLDLQVTASLGVTYYPQAEDIDADQLLRQADQAMYQAKLAGKNRFHQFDAAQDKHLRGHHESLQRIRQGLETHEFVLYFQPKVNMRTGEILGAEALIRWQHPEDGLLTPGHFLPVIQDHPLAIDIGEWVIDTALGQMGTWMAQGLNLPVSINIGAYQLQHPAFTDRLQQLLAAHPEIDPAWLQLEVLETSALGDVDGVSMVMNACRKLGVSFALDDFGTGYSSLTYLKRLPVKQLKIDQSFVRDMLDDPDDLAILEGVIGLAGAFYRQVIAEGVETLDQGKVLLQLGCELAQGYAIARPMPPADMPDWAAGWRSDARWLGRTEVNRNDLPLLYACAEYRAWLLAMEQHLSGEQEAPFFNHHQSRLALWLDSGGRSRYANQPGFAAIASMHEQVHAQAAALAASLSGGDNITPHFQIDKLRQQQARLLEQIDGWLDASG